MQIIGKVNPDLSVKVLTALDLGVSVGESRPFSSSVETKVHTVSLKREHTWTSISLQQTPRRRGLSHAPPSAVPEDGSTLTSPCPSSIAPPPAVPEDSQPPVPKHFDLSRSLSHTSPHSVARRCPDVLRSQPLFALTDHTQTTPWPTPWSRYPTSTEDYLSTTKREKKENSHGTTEWTHAPPYLPATAQPPPSTCPRYPTQPNPICT